LERAIKGFPPDGFVGPRCGLEIASRASRPRNADRARSIPSSVPWCGGEAGWTLGERRRRGRASEPRSDDRDHYKTFGLPA